MMTEQQIRTTAKLLEARDTMRRLHGEAWPQKIAEIGPIIRRVAQEGKITLFSAAIHIAQQASKDGQPMASVMVLAVACELEAAEPQPTETQGQRQTGITTQQMQHAPEGALFVWVNERLDYPLRLAAKLHRTDLLIVAPGTVTLKMVAATRKPMVVDHAAQWTRPMLDAADYLAQNPPQA
jgi:hypothetical protein